MGFRGTVAQATLGTDMGHSYIHCTHYDVLLNLTYVYTDELGMKSMDLET